MNKQQLNYKYGLPEYDTISFGTYSSEPRKCDCEQRGNV